MSTPPDPKSPKNLKAAGITFFAAGAAFFAVGVTNREMLAFVGVGAAFFAIGAGMIAKSRKIDGGDA